MKWIGGAGYYTMLGALVVIMAWNKHGSVNGIVCMIAFAIGVVVGMELMTRLTNDNRQDQKDQS